MTTDDPVRPNDQPIRAFGRFFRSYGLGVALVISSLPLAARQWDLLPQFSGMKPFLTAIASGSAFLLVGIIFSQRQVAARRFFPGRQVGERRFAHAEDLRIARWFAWAPTALWIVALGSLLAYFLLLNAAVRDVAYRYAISVDRTQGGPSARCGALDKGGNPLTFEAVLNRFGGEYPLVVTCAVDIDSVVHYDVQFFDEAAVVAIRNGTPSPAIPHQFPMGIAFLLTFCCAAAAFVLTGLKDYLQAQIGLSDRTLILQPESRSRQQRFDVEHVPGVYGVVEFSPNAPELEPIVTGPLCAWHACTPEPAQVDSEGKVIEWQHTSEEDGKPVTRSCLLKTAVTIGELDRLFYESAERTVLMASSHLGERLAKQALRQSDVV